MGAGRLGQLRKAVEPRHQEPNNKSETERSHGPGRQRMDSLRLAPSQTELAIQPCTRCETTDRRWDRIADKPFCPECQEALVLGQAAPFRERTERNLCAVCSKTGTL